MVKCTHCKGNRRSIDCRWGRDRFRVVAVVEERRKTSGQSTDQAPRSFW